MFTGFSHLWPKLDYSIKPKDLAIITSNITNELLEKKVLIDLKKEAIVEYYNKKIKSAPDYKNYTNEYLLQVLDIHYSYFEILKHKTLIKNNRNLR